MDDISIKLRTGTAVAEPASTVPDYLSSPNAVLGDEGVQWRYGRAPDYSKTRKVWEETKVSNHTAGDLPQLVENLVKNWEVEASFKPRLQDWRTIDHQNYTFAMNGGCPQSAEYMLEVGTYNAIIEANEYYSPENSDFASSHKTFKRMMPTFAWEVIEVYSGPPIVAFKWRHWGVMKNDYVGFNDKGEKITAKAHGGPIEIFGTTVARVDDQVRLQAVDTWMDPLSMFRQIAPGGVVNKEPMNYRIDKVDALETRPNDNVATAGDQTNPSDGEHSVGVSRDPAASPPSVERMCEHTNGMVTQAGACPFTKHQEVDLEQATRFAESQSGDLTKTDQAPTESRPSDDMILDDESLMPVTISPKLVGVGDHTDTIDASLKEGIAGPGTRMDNGKPGLQVGDAIAVAGAQEALAELAEPEESTVATSGDTALLEPAIPPKEESCQDSIDPNATVNDVNGTTSLVESQGSVERPAENVAQDEIERHLERPATEVHPHPKNMEEAVKPDGGEAVAAPAASEEVQQTQVEMSKVTEEERVLLMNRE